MDELVELEIILHEAIRALADEREREFKAKVNELSRKAWSLNNKVQRM